MAFKTWRTVKAKVFPKKTLGKASRQRRHSGSSCKYATSRGCRPERLPMNQRAPSLRAPSFSRPKRSQGLPPAALSWLLVDPFVVCLRQLCQLCPDCTMTSQFFYASVARLNHPEWSPFCHLLILSLGPWCSRHLGRNPSGHGEPQGLVLQLSLQFRLEHGGTLSIYPPIYLSTYLPSYLSICLSIYQSINLSINLSIYQSIYLAILSYLSLPYPTLS